MPNTDTLIPMATNLPSSPYQLVTIPFQIYKPQNNHEDWFVVRLNVYQPDKKRYIVLDGENEIFTIYFSDYERNKIDISVKLVGGSVIYRFNAMSNQHELLITYCEVAPMPPSASYTSLSTFDGMKREILIMASNEKHVSQIFM